MLSLSFPPFSFPSLLWPSSMEEDPVVPDAPVCFPLPFSPGKEVSSNLCMEKLLFM